MTWYKVKVYSSDGTCIVTERHLDESHAAESVANWVAEGLQAHYDMED